MEKVTSVLGYRLIPSLSYRQICLTRPFRYTVLFMKETRMYTSGITPHPTAECETLFPYLSGKFTPVYMKVLEPIWQYDFSVTKRCTPGLDLSP